MSKQWDVSILGKEPGFMVRIGIVQHGAHFVNKTNVDAEQSDAARLIAAAPELLKELKAAHQIIQNALNIMTLEQQKTWSDKNELDGVKDGWAVTRENARRVTIAKAEAEGRKRVSYMKEDGECVVEFVREKNE